MSHEEIIELRAAEAMAEIKALARQAHEQTARGFAFLNRSRGQKRRYEKRRTP